MRLGCVAHGQRSRGAVPHLSCVRSTASFRRAQYRIWCSFQASIVALRKLPVLVVGHQPTRLQRSLVSCGSLLLLPPWSSDDGSGVGVLGKVNFSFALSAILFAWASFGILAEGSNTDSFTAYIAAQWFIFQFIIAIFYLYSRTWLQREVMLAKNAQRVLKLLLGRAAGSTPRARAMQRLIEELTATLPWLPAHDRRDAVTVRMILDRLMSTLERRSAVCAVRCGARALGSVNAVALSAYFHAIAVLSPKDAPRGRSLHDWLRESGIDLRAYHVSKQMSSMVQAVGSHAKPGDRTSTDAKRGKKRSFSPIASFSAAVNAACARADSGAAAAAEKGSGAHSVFSATGARASWMHEYPISAAARTVEEASEPVSQKEASKCSCAEEGSLASPQLLTSELMGCGWEFVRLGFGVASVVFNPIGSWALAPPRPIGGADKPGRSPVASAGAEWRLSEMLPLRSLHVPLRWFTLFNTILYPLGFLLLCIGVAVSLETGISRQHFIDLAFSVIFVSGVNDLALEVQKIWLDCKDIQRSRELLMFSPPLPLRKSFKLELLVVLFGFAAFAGVSYGAGWVTITSSPALGGFVPISAELWFAFLVIGMFTLGRESLVATISAVSGVHAYGSCLALSEFGARHLERSGHNVIA